MIKAIAAISEESWVIWDKNRIPWEKNWDKERFRELIKNQIIIMWRWTYESLKTYYPKDNGHPWAKKNIILSTTLNKAIWNKKEIEISDNFLDILEKYKWETLRVIGGEKTFKTFLPYIDELYLTLVSWQFPWDSFFPNEYKNYMKILKKEAWRDEWTRYETYWR